MVKPVEKFTCDRCKETIDGTKFEPLVVSKCPKCGTKIRVPAVLGKYRLLRKIGEGKSGIVYKALDSVLQRTTAVKVLALEDDDSDQTFIQVREAQSQASLNHPNIVRVLSTGHHEDSTYIETELVTGGNAGKLTEAKHRLTEENLLALLQEIAEGLRAAQGAGLIPVSLNPKKILLDEKGRAKLIDFCATKRRSLEQGPDQTLAGYLAPEVVLARRKEAKVDHRADIYSLGVLIIHLLTGQPPFLADDVKSRMALQALGPRPTLSKSCPNLHPATMQLLIRMLDSSAIKRFSNYSELLDAIYNTRVALDRSPVEKQTDEMRALAAAANASHKDPPPTPAPKDDPRSATAAAAAAALEQSASATADALAAAAGAGDPSATARSATGRSATARSATGRSRTDRNKRAARPAKPDRKSASVRSKASASSKMPAPTPSESLASAAAAASNAATKTPIKAARSAPPKANRSARDKKSGQKKQSPNLLPILVGGPAVLLVGLIIIIWMVMGSGASNDPIPIPPETTGIAEGSTGSGSGSGAGSFSDGSAKTSGQDGAGTSESGTAGQSGSVVSVARADMIAHWLFDNDIKDSSNNAYHLKGPRRSRFTEGKVGRNALQIRNKNEVPKLIKTDPMTRFTICTWIKLDKINRGYNSIIMSNGWTEGTVHYQLSSGVKSKTIRLGLKLAGNKNFDANSKTKFDAKFFGKWVHLAVTCDLRSGTIKHYINGKLDATLNNPLPAQATIGPARVGGWQQKPEGGDPIRLLKGFLDDLRIYKTVLTQSQIKQVMQAK
jgi:serine/threonine protein kinase